MFFDAITLLAFANVFLNPDYLVHGDVTVLQTFRIALCTFALLAPTAILCAFLPHKRTSRWKLPLRIMLQLAAVGMLALNAFAWVVRDSSNDSIQVANAVLSYIMLAVAWLLIATMAVFFFIFVGFRGAQLQKKREDLAKSLLHEDEAVALSRAYIQQRCIRRVFEAWREIKREHAGVGGETLCDAVGLSPGSNVRSTSRVNESLLSRFTQRVSIAITGVVTARVGGERDRRRQSAPSSVEMATIGEWTAHVDDATGARYYYNNDTAETRWSLAIGAHPLPKGWTEHRESSSGMAYYHHRESDETTYDHPGFDFDDQEGAEGGGGRLGVIDEDDAPLKSPTPSGRPKGFDAEPLAAEYDASAGLDIPRDAPVNAARRKVARRLPTFVRWKFVKHSTFSLARALLDCDDGDGSGSGGPTRSSNARAAEQDDAAGCRRTPRYLHQLFRRIFRAADRRGTGSLTTLDLTT